MPSGTYIRVPYCAVIRSYILTRPTVNIAVNKIDMNITVNKIDMNITVNKSMSNELDIVISNSLNIDVIHGDIHGRSCKNICSYDYN